MPIYEFQCARCGRRFEVIKRSGDHAKPPCPECGSKRVTRLISAAGFVLKGSGWYRTDYPSEARKKGLAAEKGGGEPAAVKEKKEEGAKPQAGGKEGEHKAPPEKKEKKKGKEG